MTNGLFGKREADAGQRRQSRPKPGDKKEAQADDRL